MTKKEQQKGERKREIAYATQPRCLEENEETGVIGYALRYRNGRIFGEETAAVAPAIERLVERVQGTRF